MLNKKVTSVVLVLFCQLMTCQKTWAVDPGVTGPLAVTSMEYSLPEVQLIDSVFGNTASADITGIVHYPVDLSQGPYPIVFMQHGYFGTCYMSPGSINPGLSGNWPCNSEQEIVKNYLGYNYLGELLASHGIISVSISANAIITSSFGFMDELIHEHIELWKTINLGSHSLFGNTFLGKIDINHIGLMGHSRGGDAAAQLAKRYEKENNPSIKAVNLIAPANALRVFSEDFDLKNNALSVLLGYCDGDVPTLEGATYFDASRYHTSGVWAPKHMFTLMGANHNYFNTEWTDGIFIFGNDDWETRQVSGSAGITIPSNDSFCDKDIAGNGRLSSAEQRAAASAYISAFFRQYLLNENFTNEMIEPSQQPASALNADVRLAYHLPHTHRLDINRLDQEERMTTNNLGGTVQISGVTKNICGGTLSERYCVTVFPFSDAVAAKQPHTYFLLFGPTPSYLGLTQARLSWSNQATWYENEIPAHYGNFSGFTKLQFRASVNAASTGNQTQDFTVVLEDANGLTARVNAGSYSNALDMMPGSFAPLPKILLHSVSIPLSDFTGIDMTAIRAVRFEFDQTSSGDVLLADIAVSNPFADPQIPIEVLDTNLHSALLTALNKSSGETISRSDMLLLTSLNVRNAGISNLEGLQWAVNLQSLDLGNDTKTGIINSVTDISVLADLETLTYLNLINNNLSVAGVTALANMQQLETVLLSGNVSLNVNDDDDGDGVVNGDEFFAGTNHLSAAHLPTTLVDIQSWISGTESYDVLIEKVLQNRCLANTLKIYKDILEPTRPGRFYTSYECTLDASQIIGLVQNQMIRLHSRSDSSSADGIYSIIDVAAQSYLNIDSGHCVDQGNQIYYCSILGVNDLLYQVADAGMTTVEPELFTGSNVPVGKTPITSNDLSEIDVHVLNAQIFGIPVTLALRNALQEVQGLTVGSELETDMPHLTRGHIQALFVGGIVDWNQIKVDNGSGLFVGLAEFPFNHASAPQLDLPLSKPLVHICRRELGSGVQAQLNAKFLNVPCSSFVPPLTTGNPIIGPVVQQNKQFEDMTQCLQDKQIANKWAIGIHSVQHSDSSFRYIKIDGFAPTVNNVADNVYFDWVEPTMQWKKITVGGPNGNKLKVLKQIVGDINNPSWIAEINSNMSPVASDVSAGAFVALEQNDFSDVNTPSIPFSILNPVTTASHSFSGTSHTCGQAIINNHFILRW